MASSETALFWESVDRYMAENAPEICPDVFLFSADSLASLPFLSLCPFAVEEYDARLENTMASWDHDNWGTSSTLKNWCTSSLSASHESHLETSVYEFGNLEESVSNKDKSLSCDEVGEPHQKSDGDAHLRVTTDDVIVVEDEESIEKEDSTDDEDVVQDDGVVVEDGVIVEEEGVIEDESVIEDEDVTSANNGTKLSNEKGGDNNTGTISSDASTYSCRECIRPDDQWMIACDNIEAHSDNEAWYHYQCVHISQDSVPEGQWYCPPCRAAMEASDHADNQDPLKSKAPKKPTPSKGPSRRKSKATKASENRVTKASQVRRKPADEDAEVPRSKKKAQLMKDVTDTQLQDSEEDDSEEDDFKGDEPVKTRQKTKKVKTSSGSKDPWNNPIEEQRVIELLKEIQSDPAIDKKISFSDNKWVLIRDLLLQRYGFDRTPSSIKNRWTRQLRAQSGYDERGEGHKNPTRMKTSVESPEDRKRRRQAKAQAKAQSSTVRRKARARKPNEAREELTCEEANPPQDEGENMDGPPHGPVLDERLQYFREDEYDFSAHKNKGKRKRDDDEDEHDFSPNKNNGKRQRDE